MAPTILWIGLGNMGRVSARPGERQVRAAD
jgi:hypothetical protein